ncbi:Nidogen-1 [Dissostichus eleginoides]|uniref:Nidogen-1 n=1 Tax=Dissostichus eleginoides TaxID=100907 RepID=A0AAD9BR82_DISEL|nr:Nidogen-1 [Dissostichus eleginoides]
MSPRYRSWLWFWSCLLSLSVLTHALELEELFEFGEEAGDQQLKPGSDSTAELPLNGSLYFFGDTFHKVYINTNGFVSTVEPEAEEEYLGKMPSDFKMIAPLLGDLEDSDGQGRVLFRWDSSPEVLNKSAEHIRRAFPRDEGVDPITVFIVTWENMAARGTSGRGPTGHQEFSSWSIILSNTHSQNTFQLVVATMELSSCAILLYPRDGLQFLSTPVGGESKILEAGFNEGMVDGWFWKASLGTYFRTTTDEESSISELTEKTNSGQKGVWVYEIGSSPFFVAITPGVTPEDEEATELQSTVLPRQTEESQVRRSQLPMNTNPFTQKVRLNQDTQNHLNQDTLNHLNQDTLNHLNQDTQNHLNQDTLNHLNQDTQNHLNQDTQNHLNQDTQNHLNQDTPSLSLCNQDTTSKNRLILDTLQLSRDEDLNVNVFTYNSETCAHNQQKCSAFADCRDYSQGYCCQCKPGYYGNGKDCVAEGKPQRMNGKVNGRVFIGNSATPIELSNNDLHSYVVTNDGRAYVAISNIPAGIGPSLQPLSSLGGVIGWAFALEQPGYQNGFSLIGGVFSRQAEVIFHPGNERLNIRQQFKGIDEHDHLVVSTELEGRLPDIPLGSSVQISPYKEIYQYDRNLITSSSNRDYTITSSEGNTQTRSYQWRQTITFQSCAHDEASRAAMSTQQLSVDQIFVMFDPENNLIRYAMSNKIGSVHSTLPEQNPCFTGRHGCDINAMCRPGEGLQFTCECSSGFTGEGRYCQDTDECRENPQICGANSVCNNQPGTFRCECFTGFVFASDGRTCIEENRPVDHCQRGTHDCDAPDRASCSYTGGSAFLCSCLPGFVGDGRVCRDVDECQQEVCHRGAFCSNSQGSFACQCHPGFHGDGFQCSPTSTDNLEDKSVQSAGPSRCHCGPGCDRRDEELLLLLVFICSCHCDLHGAYEPKQCHGSIGQCWCVDASGQEIPNTRTGPGNTALCIDQGVNPPPVGPTPRPDVHPVAPGTHLLFAQSGKIERVPLDGNSIKMDEAKPLLHIPDRVVIALSYDCVEKMVYWTDITGPSISRARLSGGGIIPVVTTDLQSPEGIAVDHVSRLLFWTDSMRDTVEVSKLDGSQRRVLFDTDLINPRPIVVNPAYGRLYWADWNRDGPKIEMSNMDGTDRTVLVKDDLGLPNALTFDIEQQELCWADAGTHKLECMDPHRRLRRQIVEGIQYPFSMVSFGKNLYYTDWRREAVVSVDRFSEKETEEFLPQKRSRPYGITSTPTQCPQAYNYCSNNGGCSHLCLPRLGGFTCHCPDASEGQCEERNL